MPRTRTPRTLRVMRWQLLCPTRRGRRGRSPSGLPAGCRHTRPCTSARDSSHPPPPYPPPPPPRACARMCVCRPQTWTRTRGWGPTSRPTARARAPKVRRAGRSRTPRQRMATRPARARYRSRALAAPTAPCLRRTPSSAVDASPQPVHAPGACGPARPARRAGRPRWTLKEAHNRSRTRRPKQPRTSGVCCRRRPKRPRQNGWPTPAPAPVAPVHRQTRLLPCRKKTAAYR